MNLVEDANKRFQEKLESINYPTQKLSRRWRRYAFKALRLSGIMQIGLTPLDINKILAYPKTGRLTLYHFSFLSNNLQRTSARQLGLSLHAYIDLMTEADRYVGIWQEKSNILRAELDRELQHEAEERQKLMAEQLKNKGRMAQA